MVQMQDRGMMFVKGTDESLIISFFFQAEDGIRDLTVTGVQTCALPIYPLHPWRRAAEYTLSEWECLVAFARDGSLDIDNNVAERSLRGIALGRKNWL